MGYDSPVGVALLLVVEIPLKQTTHTFFSCPTSPKITRKNYWKIPMNSPFRCFNSNGKCQAPRMAPGRPAYSRKTSQASWMPMALPCVSTLFWMFLRGSDVRWSFFSHFFPLFPTFSYFFPLFPTFSHFFPLFPTFSATSFGVSTQPRSADTMNGTIDTESDLGAQNSTGRFKWKTLPEWLQKSLASENDL